MTIVAFATRNGLGSMILSGDPDDDNARPVTFGQLEDARAYKQRWEELRPEETCVLWVVSLEDGTATHPGHPVFTPLDAYLARQT